MGAWPPSKKRLRMPDLSEEEFQELTEEAYLAAARREGGMEKQIEAVLKRRERRQMEARGTSRR